MKEILSKEEILEIINQCSAIVGSHILDKQKLAEKLLEKIAQQAQPAGLRWVKVTQRVPDKGDLYFVKKKVADSDEEWFPGTCNFYGEWEIDPMYEVIEWLDESAPSPLQEAGWIAVEDGLPEVVNKKMKPVLVMNGIKVDKAYYFPDKFKTVEWEDWDDYSEEDFPYTTNDAENGCVWLNAGFYKEIDCDRCDPYWSSPLTLVTHWQPLPAPPIPSK